MYLNRKTHQTSYLKSDLVEIFKSPRNDTVKSGETLTGIIGTPPVD